MMRLIKILLVVLIAQLGLIIWSFQNGSEDGVYSSDRLILPANIDQSDRVLVTDADGNSLEIKKIADDTWVLPAKDNFPVGPAKINELFIDLGQLKQSWPVAQTKPAAKQLKVTEEVFEKKVNFYQGEQLLGAVYLGTSPGFRRVHLRVEGTDEVYAVEFNSFSLSVKPVDWLNRDLLVLQYDDIVAVELGDVKLEQTEAGWQLAGLLEGQGTKQDQAETLVRKIANLRFAELLDVEGVEGYGLDQPVLEFSVRLKAGKLIAYKVAELMPTEAEDDVSASSDEKKLDYVVKTSDRPYYLKFWRSSLADIMDVDRVGLVMETPVATPSVESAVTGEQLENADGSLGTDEAVAK